MTSAIVKRVDSTGESCEIDVIEAFLREGMIMREFRHENVLTLIGVAMGRNGLPMIVLPHMGNGNLKTYIANPTLQVSASFVSHSCVRRPFDPPKS